MKKKPSADHPFRKKMSLSVAQKKERARFLERRRYYAMDEIERAAKRETMKRASRKLYRIKAGIPINAPLYSRAKTQNQENP